MVNNRPPLQEQFGTPGWQNWFTQLFQCMPWKKAFNIAATLDFGSVLANSQSALTVSVTGARHGDAVTVTPYSDTNGIDYKARVSADDVVTVYACNFTTGAINPDSTTFRVIVFQQ